MSCPMSNVQNVIPHNIRYDIMAQHLIGLLYLSECNKAYTILQINGATNWKCSYLNGEMLRMIETKI